MSFYTPNTTVYLCNVPINSNQKNQFVPYTSGNSVWSAEGQRNWFLNQKHLKHSFNDFTYQRKDNIIRVQINAEILFADGSNYVVYQNQHYNGKWFYCFITRIEFINENMTALHIKTDVFQTWFFEFYKSNHMDINFIARETVIKDEMFKHTMAEPVATGAYTIENIEDITENKLQARNANEYSQNYLCCIVTSESITKASDEAISLEWASGSPNMSIYYTCEWTDLGRAMQEFANAGINSSIITTFSAPKYLVESISISPYSPPSTINPPYQPHANANCHKGSPFATSFTMSRAFYNGVHNGIDIWNGTREIYANTAGVVTFARFDDISSLERSYGNLVIIKSTTYPKTGGGEWYFWYAHLEDNSIAVQEGQTVNIGDFIGMEGKTGASDGYHLHWGVGNTTLPDAYPTEWSDPTLFGCSFSNSEGVY